MFSGEKNPSKGFVGDPLFLGRECSPISRLGSGDMRPSAATPPCPSLTRGLHVVSTARRGNSARGRGVHPNTFLLTTLALKRIQHLNWPALTPLSLLPPQTDRTRRKPTEPGFPTNEAKKLSKFHSSHELALPGARRASPAPGGEVNRHKSILSEERPFYLHWASLLQLYSKQTCLRLAIC